MAIYSVVDFDVIVKTDADNIDRVYLDAELINEGGNTNMHSYWMVNDSRATIQSIYNDINQGFNYALTFCSKVEISEFEERIYLFFKLPSTPSAISRQYTGKRI